MSVRERFKKESVVLPLMLKGYSRSMASAWYRETNYDLERYKDTYGEAAIRALHKRKYLCQSINRYDLLNEQDCKYVTDFDYMRLAPFCNTFSKWADDMLTTVRVLKDFPEHFRTIYYSIIRRYMAPRILRVGQEDREYCVADVIRLVKEKGEVELRPSYWDSQKPRYLLGWKNGSLTVNGKKSDEKSISKIFDKLYSNYLVCDPVKLSYSFTEELSYEHSIKLWLTNDRKEGPQILSGTMTIYWTEKGSRKHAVELLDVEKGTVVINGRTVIIPDWEQIKERICCVSRALTQLSFYTMTITLKDNAPFQFLHFSTKPRLPEVAYQDELNDYLLERLEKKNRHKVSLLAHFRNLRMLLFHKFVKKFCRKGVRPYMQELWLRAWWSDLLHTKLPLKQKIWAWKRGFISYHIYQYGLTEENYKNYLADYDYYWLNRINNEYQKWINDKTTYRLVMEPFKEYVPKYYYSVFKRWGKTELARMWDCPEGFTDEFESMLALLRKEGKLALKASAGTHGDGFYCLSYENNQYHANGEVKSKKELLELLESLKSFYVITEYLRMHPRMNEIYSGAVSTIRMMVINTKGFNPQIMQTYMRIGSKSTGFTDNVGYGGICVMVDKETGELYEPQTIQEHIYYPCPNHPDTGTPIAGQLPHWDLICSKVLEISRYLCELEYLGFDIAITPEGFCVLEINIHQDLHKANLFSEEINEFFRRKISYKRG